jgi:2,3-bisphosphoglycerate-dependent phosphoglycerate mutase
VVKNLAEYPIDLILSSPYTRARETITPLSKQLNIPIHIEPDLRERRLSSGAVHDFFHAVEQTWSDPTFAHPGGESNSAAQKRGLAILSQLQDEGSSKHIVISSHGNLLAVLLQHFDPSIDYHFWKMMTFPDIYQLRISPPGKGVFVRLWE